MQFENQVDQAVPNFVNKNSRLRVYLAPSYMPKHEHSTGTSWLIPYAI